MNILRTIENGVLTAWHIVETDVAAFGALFWKDAKPVLVQVEGQVYKDLRTVILGFVTAFQGKDLAEIETALLNTLSAAESALLADAQALGSDLLQALIADLRGS